MKRLLAAMAGIGLVFSMAGCGQPENEQAKAPPEETMEIPNPFTDCGTLEEAQELAGFSLTLPESLEGCPEKSFRAMDKRMLEVIYREGGTEKARIRKGIGQEDVSGDYNSYGDIRQIEAAGTSVTLKGEKEAYSLAVWTEGEYSYAVSLSAPEEEAFWQALAQEMMEQEGAAFAAVTFPAYQEENEKDFPAVAAVNRTPPFQVSLELPEGWRIGEPGEKADIPVPGEFYSVLPIFQGEMPIGYIGFNVYEPVGEEIPQEDYYKAVYSSLRLSSAFHWDPYTPVKTTRTAQTAVADIWYLEEIENHLGEMASVPQLETLGILAYDKELEVYVGIAFLPDAVSRSQAKAIAKSMTLSPVE